MYDTMKIANKDLAHYAPESTVPDFEIGNSRFAIGVIMTMSALIGAWGVACLISGLANTGGLHEIGRGLITALTGM